MVHGFVQDADSCRRHPGRIQDDPPIIGFLGFHNAVQESRVIITPVTDVGTGCRQYGIGPFFIAQRPVNIIEKSELIKIMFEGFYGIY